MVRKIVLAALLASGISAAASAPAAAQGLNAIQGQWSEDRTGESIVIRRGGFGYEAWISWVGQAAIGSSGGYEGSDIKVESAGNSSGNGVRCFYKVNLNNNREGFRKMTWALRAGNSPKCPHQGVWSGVLDYNG